MLTMTPAERRLADRTAVLCRVMRSAKRIADTMRQINRGVYEIEPAAVLALRSSVAAAELVVCVDERISDL
jgi:hypothetical protein